jgi:gluconolactonase
MIAEGLCGQFLEARIHPRGIPGMGTVKSRIAVKGFAALGFVLSLFLVAHSAGAESLVDSSEPLETLSTEFGLCDGPAWDGASVLFVPDVKGGKLYRYRPKQKKLEVALADAGKISATFYNHGRLYLADNGESGIAWLDRGKKVRLGGEDKDAKPPRRPNDLVVDNQQGIYYTLTGQGQVIYLSADGKQVTAVEKVDTPNGLILSPDERTLYVASYVPKKIWAYDVIKPGVVTGGRLLASMDDGPEKGADGMTVDRAGNVYCAGPQHVWVWNPAGKLLAKIETPTKPINCAFGDSDMHSLYITGMGGLYRQRMLITGRPPQPSASEDDRSPNDTRPSNVLPATVAAHWDVVYAQYGDRKLLADIFVPKDKPGPLPTIVVVHGGGWLNGDKSKFRPIAQALAARGYVTAAIEYRLAGEATFPAAIQDCNAAVRFLRATAGRYKIDINRIGAVGGSAGGHLVGLMAAAPGVKELQGIGGNPKESSRLQAAIVMAGPMELATGQVAEESRNKPNSFVNLWLGQTIDQDQSLYELASPITHFSKQTPPILFMTGELDNPSRDDAAIARLKDLGVWTEQKIYSGGKHGCWMQLPWFDQMLDDMDAFFQEKLK